MTIEMKKLHFAHDALEPHISKETMHYHYNKHYKSYVENLNKLIKGTEFEKMDVGKIIQKSGSGPIFNNAAQIWNHEFYWSSMGPAKDFEELDEDSRLHKAIVKTFKSMDAFQKEFGEKGKKLFGSGWVWLVEKNGNLSIEATHNAMGPKNSPIFVCDVWEHAYYLDTQNERPKYIENFFKVVDWKFAEKNM